MRTHLVACVLLVFGLSLVHVPYSLANGTNSFRTIIKNQMTAFKSGNAEKAFSYASTALQRRFQTPTVFMSMVKQGYKPVYRPKSVTFGRLRETKSGPVQEVYLVGPENRNWLALYSFVQQEDGAWRISGCYLVKSDDLPA